MLLGASRKVRLGIKAGRCSELMLPRTTALGGPEGRGEGAVLSRAVAWIWARKSPPVCSGCQHQKAGSGLGCGCHTNTIMMLRTMWVNIHPHLPFSIFTFAVYTQAYGERQQIEKEYFKNASLFRTSKMPLFFRTFQEVLGHQPHHLFFPLLLFTYA